MPCFVHPDSDQLQVVPSGASTDWKLLRDLLVFPLIITWGGTLPPAALIAAIAVIVSRLPLVLPCKYLLPFAATTFLVCDQAEPRSHPCSSPHSTC